MLGFVRESTFRLQKRHLKNAILKWKRCEGKLKEALRCIKYQSWIIDKQNESLKKGYDTIVALENQIEDLEEANKMLLMENEQLDEEVEEAGNNSCELDREYNKLEFDYAVLESERDKLVTQLDEIMSKGFLKDCISKEAVLNLLAEYDPEFHGNFSDCIKSLPTVADFVKKMGGVDGEQERDNH